MFRLEKNESVWRSSTHYLGNTGVMNKDLAVIGRGFGVWTCRVRSHRLKQRAGISNCEVTVYYFDYLSYIQAIDR
jgi:hypothetical protein